MNYLDYITFNKEKDLICLTNSDGIHLYDIYTFQLLIKIDHLRIGLSGDVYKPKIFYNSQIISFIILETQLSSEEQSIIYNDSKIQKYSLVLYGIKNYEILGKIKMKNFIEINDYLITKFFIIIMIDNKNKALFFKTSNLEFFKSISNVYLSRIYYSDDYFYKLNYKNNQKNNLKQIYKNKINKCIIAYINAVNKKIVVRIQFIFNEDYSKILGEKKKYLELDLNTKELKYISLLSSFLIVSSAFGNKVHIYDLLKGHLKYCLNLGNFPYEISELHLDNKHKIISIITNNKYLKLYKLNKLSNQCNCNLHQDENISINEERGMLDKFKHKIGVGRADFLCRYKVNYNEFDMKFNRTLIIFDKKSYDYLYVIQLNKNVKKLKFDRKKSKDMINMEEITLPNYNIDKFNIKDNKSDKKNIKKINKIKEKESDNIIFDDDI